MLEYHAKKLGDSQNREHISKVHMKLGKMERLTNPPICPTWSQFQPHQI